MRFNLELENQSYQNLETILTDFDIINTEYQKQKKEACDKFHVAFEAFVKDFFTLVPSVKRVEWTQYTPHFSDGDTCVFMINEPYFYNFIEDYENEEEDNQDSNHWELYSWNLREYQNYGLTEEEQKLIQFLNDVIYNNEDFMYDIYGDHQKIIITKDSIESDYYDHD